MSRKRDWRLQIGSVLITPGAEHQSSVKFQISKSTKREPNKATIEIMNLSNSRVRQLEALRRPVVQLDAGYTDGMDTIFLGDVKDLWTVTDAPDRSTKLMAQDGGQSYLTATIRQSFGPGTSVASVIQACASAMGVGVGNTSSVAQGASLANGGTVYAVGTTVSGPAWRELSRVCQSAGLRWSVQNGALQLRRAGRPAVTSAILLSPGTGLIGSPSRGQKDRRGKVRYTVTTLLRPGVYPGRAVRVESRDLTANLLIKGVQISGDTTGADWYATLDLEVYE